MIFNYVGLVFKLHAHEVLNIFNDVFIVQFYFYLQDNNKLFCGIISHGRYHGRDDGYDI